LAFQIVFTKYARKGLENYEGKPALQRSLNKQLAAVARNPFEPPYEKLYGDMLGAYSRRINGQHRLVYRVEENKAVILSVWTHYE
jgi:Txe/YoeB family toxin of toxin-antitoxin system